MNKKLFLALLLSVLALSCEQGGGYIPPIPKDTKQYNVTLNFPGVSNVGMNVAYIAWIEDDQGNNLQNLYICNKMVQELSGNSVLLGTALPYFVREKSSGIDTDNLDGISGASTQTAMTIIQDLNKSITGSFRVCMEIDRSKNGNTYFNDRPSFIYKSDLISLSLLQNQYPLTLRGYMGNDSSGGDYGQDMIDTVPDYEVWKYMTDTSYISPRDMFLNETDTVSGLTVSVQEK